MTRTVPFADDFWEARYNSDDVRAYKRYLKIVNLSKQGHTAASIERILRTNNVSKYLRGQKKSFLVNLEEWRERLGPPTNGFQWLPIRLKPRGTPGDEWIQVPSKIKRFSDVCAVLSQRRLPDVSCGVMKAFGFKTKKELTAQRTNLFAFFLGAVVGDAGKHRKGTARFPSRSISLVLSKNKPNSYRFGEFASLCANVTLGLRMHRINDLPVSDKRYGKTECYAWLSSSSPLVSWVFNVCLGLRDNETTTYNPLRMDWLLNAPREFRIHFLQGLGESDGWPDAGDDVVKVVTSPNTRFLKRLLESLRCRPHTINQPPVQLLVFATTEADRLPFFSPRIASNLHRNTEILAKAVRYPERLRLPQEAINTIRKLSGATSNANELSLKLALETGYKVSGHTIRKYAFRS